MIDFRDDLMSDKLRLALLMRMVKSLVDTEV